MKNIFSRIWFPIAVVSATAANILSVETTRMDFGKDVMMSPDTIIYVNKFGSKDGSLDDAGFTITELDTVPRIMARDTMKVPDSLRTIDPFRYKYYVALKDSLTHVIVRDSLKAVGDSLDWPKLDSLYAADSVAAAKAAFDAWYAGLSKSAKKKYDFEQKMILKRKITDSIDKVKQEKIARRDSIREETPRILETFAIPDSLQYKRIISWSHDRSFHQLQQQPLDTNFNPRFNDYPYLKKDVGASWLGVAGSALQTYDYFKRTSEGVAFYEPFEAWSKSPSTLPFYNTKTPYTELAYWGTLFASKDKASDNIHILTTQNIYPELNFTLSYDRFGGGGMLKNEEAKNKNFVASTNYLGKKYLMHAGYIYNMVSEQENGGLVDSYWIRDTTVDAREIQVYLNSASTKLKKNTLFLDQQYRIPFNFINNIRQ
ncbi:MAG: putative porin, partial [Bacteroidales bacterium]|nr:putative porin [Bacteroidales bacterium]